MSRQKSSLGLLGATTGLLGSRALGLLGPLGASALLGRSTLLGRVTLLAGGPGTNLSKKVQ